MGKASPAYLEYAQVVGSFAQVATACVALYLAWRANRINHAAIFVGRVVDELLEARLQAQRVKKLYLNLFEPFTDVNDKHQVRTAWLQTREEVGEALDALVEAFPELKPTRDAWSSVEDVEDSHAVGDALTCANSGHAKAGYVQVCAKFNSAVGSCIQSLRDQ